MHLLETPLPILTFFNFFIIAIKQVTEMADAYPETEQSSRGNHSRTSTLGGASAVPTPANNSGGGSGWGDRGFFKGGMHGSGHVAVCPHPQKQKERRKITDKHSPPTPKRPSANTCRCKSKRALHRPSSSSSLGIRIWSFRRARGRTRRVRQRTIVLCVGDLVIRIRCPGGRG